MRFNRDQRGFEPVVLFLAPEAGMLNLDLGQAERSTAFSADFLGVNVERGENSQSLAGQHLGRITLGQFMFDVVDEERRVVVFGEDFTRAQRLGDRDVVARPC